MRKKQFWNLALIWFVLLAPLAGLAEIPGGTNLLTNGSATAPLATGWTFTNGGTGWATSTSGGKDGIGGQFLTSYALCTRNQTIDLLAKGATAAELDVAPPIRVEEYFQSVWLNNNSADGYYIKVELRSATNSVIASWNVGTSTALKLFPAINVWYQEAFEFKNYGPGVRYIYFEDGGQDNGFWADQYGANMDGASVTFMNIPPTEIVASRTVFASNAPAGGLIGYFSAADVDDTVHTFALAPEVTTPVSHLIAASDNGWRYFDGVTPVAADWTSPTMNDSTWGSGQAPLGYDSSGADTWKKTVVGYGGNAAAKPITSYFRKSFTLNNPQDVVSLGGTLMVDDGCVIYLNGHEVYRENLPTDDPLSPTAGALAAIGAGDESDYKPWAVPQDKLVYLQPGPNVIAVEVHQDKITSSDLSLDVTLDAVFATTTNSYDNDLFTVVDDQLRLAQAASATPAGPKTVRVQATDRGGNSIFRLVTITPLGVAYTATPTALALNPKTFAEHQAFTVPLGEFTSTDADPNDVVSYELVSGTGDTDNHFFSIRRGKLYAAQVTDFETKSALSIRVRVVDSVGLSSTTTFSLTLTDDLNEDDDFDGLPESAEDVNNNGVVDLGETSPYLADTDNDTYSDKVERDNGSDPTDKLSVPASVPIRQIIAHATGDSWMTAASWEGGLVPQGLNTAIVDNLTFRPPPTADPVFPGLAVDLRNGAVFRLKHTGLATVSKIKLDNATIQQGMTVAISVGGPGSVLETNTVGILDAAGYPLNIQASLSGKGAFRAITSVTGGVVNLSSPALNFTGDLVLSGSEVDITHATALGDAMRVIVRAGKFKPTTALALPNTILLQANAGIVSLSANLSVATAVFSGVLVPAGTYTVTDLVALGIPSSALEDGGGTLTVSGTLNEVDSDQDGATDLAEAYAQTNSRDVNSRLGISSLGTESGPLGGLGVRLTWASVPGVTYQVEFSESLPPVWQMATTIIATSPTTTYLEDFYAGLYPGHGFYRLQVVP